MGSGEASRGHPDLFNTARGPGHVTRRRVCGVLGLGTFNQPDRTLPCGWRTGHEENGQKDGLRPTRKGAWMAEPSRHTGVGTAEGREVCTSSKREAEHYRTAGFEAGYPRRRLPEWPSPEDASDAAKIMVDA